jgi:signal transduction histidine kinase
MLEYTISSKKRFTLIAAFMIVFLTVLIATTIVLYRRAERHLDNELGERLEAVASGLARSVQIVLPDSVSADDVDAALLTHLYEALTENDLSNVVVLTREGLTVVDLGGFSEPGETNPFIDLDFSAVTLARSGLSAYTNLYRSGDVFMKSAYAPIKSVDDEVVGILGVEAGAGFFDDLRELSNVIVFILGASIIAVTVIGSLFYRQSVALDRAQETIIRRENLATMGRMVANIAHDIRNPLSIIKTSAQRLRKKQGTDDEVLSYISDEVDELNRILTSYLDFAGSDKATAFEANSAERIIRRCLLIVEPEIQARRIELTQRISEEDFAIEVDEKRAQQAVVNVLINALQAVDDGGSILISLEKRRPYGVIGVVDNGRGIDEKDLKEVTKPFYTNRPDGSGLGLSIVQTVLDEHGGRLSINSRAGSGTSVELSFPLAPGSVRRSQKEV